MPFRKIKILHVMAANVEELEIAINNAIDEFINTEVDVGYYAKVKSISISNVPDDFGKITKTLQAFISCEIGMTLLT